MSTDPQITHCTICKTTSSPIWRRNDHDAVVCLECYAQKKADKNSSSSGEASSTAVNQAPKKKKNNKRNKLDRAGRSSNSPLVNVVSKITYRGRRSIMKETPIKSPAPEPEILTTNSVLHKGVAYEIGDVVSILDYSGGVYYAIIRGLLVDQYSEKYAVLTWVLPKAPNPVEFDPINFILGPEEDEPRSLETLEFVCHSPRSSSFSLSSQYDLDLLNLWISPTQRPS